MERNNWICERDATGRITLAVDEDGERTVRQPVANDRQVVVSGTDADVSLPESAGRYEAETRVTKATHTRGASGGYSFVRVLDVRPANDGGDSTDGGESSAVPDDDPGPGSSSGGVKRQSRNSPSDASNPLNDPIRGSRNGDVGHRI